MIVSIRQRIPGLVVVALMLVYSIYFSALSIQRHNTFRTHKADMGQMDQALWNTLHGNLLEDTRPEGNNAPRLTDHVEPIFLLLPFSFLIYDGAEILFVLQSIAIALGAVPIFWIAKRRLKNEWAAVVFAAMYLLFPALQAANLAEFHAVAFAPAPLLLAYNYGQERAWKRFALFAIIALAVKEEIALLVFMLALYFAFKFKVKSKKAKGLSFSFELLAFNLVPFVLALVSLAWFFIAVFIIVPHFSPGGRSVYTGRYTCMTEALRDPLTALPNLMSCVFIPAKIEYVINLLASVGFVALLDPVALFLGAPSFVLNLLSGYDAQYSGTYHYSAPVAPYFVLAAIGGAGWLVDFLARRLAFARTRILAGVLVPVCAIALGYHLSAGYTPIGGEFFWPQVTVHQQNFARFAKQIPPGVKVSTMGALHPHLSHRRVIYLFPTVRDAEYILLDVSQATNTNAVDFAVAYRDALAQGFGIRDALDGYILLQRGLTQKTLPDGFYNFLRACSCTLPQKSVVIDFDDKIRFLGYDVKQDDWQRVYLRTYWTRLPTMDRNNYTLFPFYPNVDGAPRADAQLPDLLIQFWYPSSRWTDGEVVVADTLPIDLGERAQMGLGVFFGASWDDAEYYLKPHTTVPISADGRWVSLGEIVRAGKTYQIVDSK